MSKKLKRNNKDKKLMGLYPGVFPKNKQWQIDQDYVADLSQADQEWMAKFNEEYYGGKIKKGDKTALHQTEEQRKDCYNRNNISNRDLYSIKQTGNAIGGPDELPELDENIDENSLVDYLDAKGELKKFLEGWEPTDPPSPKKDDDDKK